MSEKQMKAEQTSMDLSAVEARNEVAEVNVFRPDDISAEQKDLIRRHQLWLSTIQKEYPLREVFSKMFLPFSSCPVMMERDTLVWPSAETFIHIPLPNLSS